MRREARYNQIRTLLESVGEMTSFQIARAIGLTVAYTVLILSEMVACGYVERLQRPMRGGAVGYKYVYRVPIENRVKINGERI